MMMNAAVEALRCIISHQNARSRSAFLGKKKKRKIKKKKKKETTKFRSNLSCSPLSRRSPPKLVLGTRLVAAPRRERAGAQGWISPPLIKNYFVFCRSRAYTIGAALNKKKIVIPA